MGAQERTTPRAYAPSEELNLEWDMYPFEGSEAEAIHASLGSGRDWDMYPFGGSETVAYHTSLDYGSEWVMYPFGDSKTGANHASLDSGRKGDTYRGRDSLRCGLRFCSPASGSALRVVFSSGKIRHGSRSRIGLSLKWDPSNGYGERRRRKNGDKPGEFQRLQIGKAETSTPADQRGGSKIWKEEFNNLYVSSYLIHVKHTFKLWDRGKNF